MRKEKFDPTKKYSWKPTDEFTLLGQELDYIHNTIHTVVFTDLPDGQKYLALNEILKITSKIIQDGYYANIVEETAKSEDIPKIEVLEEAKIEE